MYFTRLLFFYLAFVALAPIQSGRDTLQRLVILFVKPKLIIDYSQLITTNSLPFSPFFLLFLFFAKRLLPYPYKPPA